MQTEVKWNGFYLDVSFCPYVTNTIASPCVDSWYIGRLVVMCPVLGSYVRRHVIPNCSGK